MRCRNVMMQCDDAMWIWLEQAEMVTSQSTIPNPQVQRTRVRPSSEVQTHEDNLWVWTPKEAS